MLAESILSVEITTLYVTKREKKYVPTQSLSFCLTMCFFKHLFGQLCALHFPFRPINGGAFHTSPMKNVALVHRGYADIVNWVPAEVEKFLHAEWNRRR